MNNLPIHEILPQLTPLLASHPAVIVHAPPGAGKTTIVPLELLKAPFLDGLKIIMLEPRRLAATNAARWMASCVGEEVGQTIGYSIRFDNKISSKTRIEVVTEGILTRRLQTDPYLQGVGAVIFDEFHERNLHSDIALALCRDVQKGLRDDLKILVMSATLDGSQVSKVLDGAPVLSSQGRSYPVEIRYFPEPAKGRIAETTARAVQNALRETDGDILVFLPGAGEIKECRRLLQAATVPAAPYKLHLLYGDLPFAEQELAIAPGRERKVVLATNIAETSLTIEGVRVVIDSGWRRQLRFDPVSGLNRLETVRVSAASADQRCGRAGRLGPGVCYRLWSEHTQRTLVPFGLPEIVTSDLTSLALDLALWGIRDPATLCWLDPPPAGALAEGRKLLMSLGALDSGGYITTKGKRMTGLPVHPRLALMLLEGESRGLGALACDLAAILSERDIFRTPPGGVVDPSDSDLLDRVEAFREWRLKINNGERLDHHACKTADRAAGQFGKILGIGKDSSEASSETVGLLLALAFPDRIAQQRESGSDRYLLANGRGGRMSARSGVRNHEYIVATAVDGGDGGDGMIHMASTINEATLRREFPHLLLKERVVAWDREQGRASVRETEKFQALVLMSHPSAATPAESLEALMDQIRRSGLGMLHWSSDSLQFRQRVLFLARTFPEGGWPDLSDEHLSTTIEDWLKPWLLSPKALSNMARIDLLAPLRSLLSWELSQKMDQGAPTHLQVPSGSRIALSYCHEGAPVLAVKLQELFGLADTPTIAWGKVRVLLHLLSPARRPLQVTHDLKSFWNSTYPEVKKELKGRYPRHPWPDDPWNAVPTRHVKKRM